MIAVAGQVDQSIAAVAAGNPPGKNPAPPVYPLHGPGRIRS